MEVGVDCGIKHAKSKSPLLLFRSTPPFSAISKFLEVAHDNYKPPSQNIYQQNKSKTTVTITTTTTTTTTNTSTTMDDFGDFSSSSSSTNSLRRVDDNDATMHENNFVDGLFLDENHNESQYNEISYEMVPRNEEINSLPSKKMKKAKGFKEMIKGQWTEEEDRMLTKLVSKYGERKWAMIARGHLVGRAGKQCRERWHNHLRPDIKKDAWDEEEERMLVSAHQEFGNKWAEIARRIPGRSENSIKNHWNATRRRQNSRRKNKNKVDIDNNQSNNNNVIQPSFLQDYIKKTYPCNNNKNLLRNPKPAKTATLDDAAMSPSSESTYISRNPPNQFDHTLQEPCYDDYYFESSNTSLAIVSNPCHDELVFMQQLFKENHNNNYYIDQNHDYEIMEEVNHHYSDKFLADLLEGRSSYVNHHEGGFLSTKNGMDEMEYHQGFISTTSKKKDMDLFEMVFSTQIS